MATLELLSEPGVYESLEEKTRFLADGLGEAARVAGVPVALNRLGSLGCGFFTPGPVTDFESALKADTNAYAIFFREMLKRGVYMAPAQFEVFFVSMAHEKKDLEFTIEAAAAAYKEIAQHCAC